MPVLGYFENVEFVRNFSSLHENRFSFFLSFFLYVSFPFFYSFDIFFFFSVGWAGTRLVDFLCFIVVGLGGLGAWILLSFGGEKARGNACDKPDERMGWMNTMRGFSYCDIYLSVCPSKLPTLLPITSLHIYRSLSIWLAIDALSFSYHLRDYIACLSSSSMYACMQQSIVFSLSPLLYVCTSVRSDVARSPNLPSRVRKFS